MINENVKFIFRKKDYNGNGEFTCVKKTEVDHC